MSVPTVTCNNGIKIPMFGLGTYLSKPGEVSEAVKYAIEIGYRHVDTAAFYGNEKEVGDAIKEKIKDGTIKREDIFVTTKLWCTSHKKESVVPACRKSLANLGLDYMDLYLIHFPFALKEGDELLPKDESGKCLITDTDYLETWKGMEDCQRQGLTRSIGISNFNSEQIKRLLDVAEIKPINNQVEVSINLNQQRLINFCKEHDITVTAYSPLGRPGNISGVDNSWDHPTIKTLVKKYNKTPAQIALRFVIQLGTIIIPKSVTKSRIKENFEIFDFTLSDEEMREILSIGTGERLVKVEFASDSIHYPFNIPF